MLKTIVNKLTSARFFMAVAFTITGCYMAVKATIPNEAFIGILTLVVREYFAKPRPEESNGKPPTA